MKKILEDVHLWEKPADPNPFFLREKLEGLSGLKPERSTRIMEYADKCISKTYPCYSCYTV